MGKITNKQKRFVRRNYPGLSTEEIAKRLKIKPGEVKQVIRDLGLEPRQENSIPKMTDKSLNRYAAPIVSILTACYIVFFSLVSILRYNGFDYSDFDLAVHAQTVRNILHGSIYSSILGIPFLGNHLNLILFLIAPVYAIFQTPLTLLLLQTVFIGLAVIPIYLLARDILDRKFALVFSLLYLVYPALNFINRYEFHPVAFSIFFLLFMIYYFEKARFVPFLCFMFLSLLCKENIALGILFFGLYILISRKRSLRWSIVPLVTAILWLTVGLKVMFHLNRGMIDFGYIYSHLGRSAPEIIGNIVKHPYPFLRLVFARQNMKLLTQLFFPLGFVPFLSLKALFIPIPFFLQQLLSIRAEDHTIRYHYAAKLIPFLFMSAIYGTRSLLRSRFIKQHQWAFVAALLIVSAVSNLSFGLLPKMPTYFSHRRSVREINYKKQDLVDRIPEDASVVATFAFLPKLSQRKSIFSFHHVYIGKYTLSNKEYVLPSDVEYALIDFDDYLTFTSFYRPEQYVNLQKFLFSGRWALVEAVDNIALFKKGYQSDKILFASSEQSAALSPARIFVEDNITARGYRIENRKVRAGDTIRLSFIWECLRKSGKDYWVAFKLVDENGNAIHEYNHPICYRIYPTYSWKKGDILKEYCWILAPSKTKTKEATLKMGIFDRSTAGPKGGVARGVSVRTTGLSFDNKGWINLGKIQID